MAIPFTQFLRPNGKSVPTEIEMPPDIEKMAQELIAKGYKFEIEELNTNEVHMDCSLPGADGPVALELSDNGPAIIDAVKRLVKESHEFVFEKNKGQTVEFWDEEENPEEFWK